MKITRSSSPSIASPAARRARPFALLTALSALSCDPTPVVVSSTTDGASGSLRAAISAANASGAAARIELPAGNYTLTRCGADDSNVNGDLDLTTAGPVTLAAQSGQVTIRQTCAGERVLDSLGSGRLRLLGVTLTGGNVTAAAGQDARGGAVRAAGDVELSGAAITGNTATGGTGSALRGGAAHGGGLYVGGSLFSTGSRLESNAALGGTGTHTAQAMTAGGSAEGGGAYVVGAVNITGTTFASNRAEGGRGAGGGAARGGALAQALDSTGEVAAVTSGFSGNRALAGDTSVLCSAEQRGADATAGALAAAGLATVDRVSFTDNTAVGGSAPWGPCSLNVTNAGSGRGGALFSPKAATLTGVTASSNSSGAGQPSYWCRSGGYCEGAPNGSASGGAIWAGAALTVSGGLYSGNATSTEGGALFAVGQLRVNGGEYTSNSGGSGWVARASGDAIIESANIHHNSSGELLYARDSVVVDGQLMLSRTLLRESGGVSANGVNADKVTFANNRDGITAQSARLVNTTITGTLNSAVSVVGRLELDHVTLVDNAHNISAQRLASHRSVVMPGAQPACAAAPVIESATYNWFGDTSCGLTGSTNTQAGGALFLAPLADNGGPVPTRLPALASPLVDRIPSSACAVAVDARGTARPQGAGCDIGAAEVSPIAGSGAADMAVTFTNPPATVVYGEAASWRLTVTNKGPSAAPVGVTVDVPSGLEVTSSPATGGAVCTTAVRSAGAVVLECAWNTPLAAGSSAQLTINAQVGLFVSSPLEWRAALSSPQLTSPRSDDVAELRTPVAAENGLAVVARTDIQPGSAGTRLAQVIVALSNLGPSLATATQDAPIVVRFQPAPGVTVSPAPIEAYYYGVVHPGGEADVTSFQVSVSGAWPAVVGTFVLDPGSNQALNGGSFPLVTTDLVLRGERSQIGVQPAGTPTRFRFTVSNTGTRAAENLVMIGNGSSLDVTWSPQVGTVEGTNFPTWRIPSLAPGASAVLEGTVPYIVAANAGNGIVFHAGVRSSALDTNPNNSNASIDASAAPQGMADLTVTSIDIIGGNGGPGVVTVTVRNDGPHAAVSASGWTTAVSLEIYGSNVLGSRAGTSNWSCASLSCQTSAPIAPGATASFEFLFDAISSGQRLTAYANALSVTPDPRLYNNDLEVIAP